MEPVLFLSAMFVITVAGFQVLGALYGLIRSPAVLFPFKLSLKMSASAWVGMLLFGFGGIVAATWVMTHEFAKRADHNPAACIAAGVVISTCVCGLAFLSAYYVAFAIFE